VLAGTQEAQPAGTAECPAIPRHPPASSALTPWRDM
jgi:hypothetical protein